MWQEAIAHDAFHECPPYTDRISRGDTVAAFDSCDHVIEGEMRIGGQEHFYMETHCARVVPTGEDGEIAVHSGETDACRIQVGSVSFDGKRFAQSLSIC